MLGKAFCDAECFEGEGHRCDEFEEDRKVIDGWGSHFEMDVVELCKRTGPGMQCFSLKFRLLPVRSGWDSECTLTVRR